jgi:uncharacterized coiled-coil DUF342 family protein
MKSIFIFALAGLVIAAPASALTLRGRHLAALPISNTVNSGNLYTQSTTYSGAGDNVGTISRAGFNALGSHNFNIDTASTSIDALSVEAPGSSFAVADCSINPANETTTLQSRSKCDIHPDTNAALARLRCQESAMSAASGYMKICQHDRGGVDNGVPYEYTGSAPASHDPSAYDAGCHDALCIAHTSGSDVLKIDYQDFSDQTVEECETLADQDFLNKLDCAYADESGHSTSLAASNHDLLTDQEILPDAADIENLVNKSACDVDGTDDMEMALYDLHFTLQEQVLLKLWEHARSQCLNLIHNRDTDLDEYVEAVNEAAQAQQDLSNMIRQYDDFHTKVSETVLERVEAIGNFTTAVNELVSQIQGNKDTAISQLHSELDYFLKDAKAAASNYRNDLAPYFESLATKKAHVKDMHEKWVSTNDQVKEHNEDLRDLDTTLSSLLDTIVSAMDTTHESIDTIKDEGEEVLAQGVAPRSMTRESTDKNATQVELLMSCDDGQIVKQLDSNGVACDCDNLDTSCVLTTTGSEFSSNEHREDCSDDGTTGVYGQLVCSDDPEADHISERTYTVTRDNGDIIVRDDSDYTDDAQTAYDMYADATNEDTNNNGDFADADTWNQGTCGLCA